MLLSNHLSGSRSPRSCKESVADRPGRIRLIWRLFARNLPMRALRLISAALFAFLSLATIAASAQVGREPDPDGFSTVELVGSGHRFFGTLSRGLALTIQEAVKRWGEPNGYILGQEASGAFVAGLRYGEGTLYTRNVGQLGRAPHSASISAGRALAP